MKYFVLHLLKCGPFVFLSVDLQTANGRESLFWSISRWEKYFPEMIKLVTINCQCKSPVNEQKIGGSWEKVTKLLLKRFIEGHPEEGYFANMTPDTVQSDPSDRDCQCKSVVIEQRIEEVTIGESWKGVTRCLLSRLINNHPGEGFLPDTTPIINLIILSGKHFQIKGKNFTENLFNTFIKQIGKVKESTNL